MSYNGSGTFVINSSGQPVVAGTVITATAFNALTADLGTGLSTAITKDGQTTPTANIPLGTYKITGLGAGTAATDAVRMSQLQSNSTTFLTASGTDTLTATASPTLTAYAAGNLFTFVVANTNTTAVTLNIDSLGAKAITRDGTTALAAADLVATEVVVVIYDGTRFQVVNPNAATNFRVSGTLGVTGVATLASNATVGGTLNVTGVATLGTGAILGTPASGALTNCTGVVLLSTFTTAGDIVQATGSGAVARLGIGAAGTVPMAGASTIAYRAALGKAIYGLTYDNGTDATNDININTGGAMDATGAYWLTLSTALGKQSDAAWAVGGTTGTPLGWLDTGSVGNSDYYIWLIARSDTGVIDSLCSLSSTAPTMPTSYDFKRLIGWFKRTGGTIVTFTTYETEGGGLELLWAAPTLDVNLANTLTNARRTDAVKVPLNFSVIAILNVAMQDSTSAADNIVYCPDQVDMTPSSTASNLSNRNTPAVINGQDSLMWLRTSATGTIAARSTNATMDFYGISTQGFCWARRN